MINTWWKKLLWALLAVLIVIRMILPTIMLKKANEFLADYSKVYSAHIGDIDLSFIRMAYRFENTELRWREGNERVLQVDSVDVSLAWRELIKGRLLTDIDISGTDIFTSNLTLPAIKAAQAEAEGRTKKEEPTAKGVLFPVRIERVVIRDTTFEYAPTKETPKEERFTIRDGQFRLSNVTPLKKNTLTVGTFQATVMDSAKFKGVANLILGENKADWDVDAELRQFDLTKANPFLLNTVPFTFTKGTLDLFMEAKSQDGAMIGYVKPFLNKADIIAKKEKFKGTRHFLVEIVAALGNIVAQRKGLESVATKLDFSKPGPEAPLKMDILGAVANAVEHKLDRPIAPSIEDEIKLKTKTNQ